MQILQKINFILPKIQHKKLLVAVSGGVDSMVLLHICLQHHWDISVAHCNYGLRGEDSVQDELFVKNYCLENKIPFFCKNFDTKKIQETTHQSIQMLARELRYDFFKELMTAHNFDFLLTAHHQTDQVETILLNFIRGTGITGLRGILPISEKNKTIRPLFNFSKKEILQYANLYQLLWREDVSNTQNKYLRNIIRNQVLPIFREINPSLERKSAENSEKLVAVEGVWKKYLKKLKKKICQKENNLLKINLKDLQNIPNANVVLAEWLKKYEVNYAQSQEIWANKDAQTGKFFENKMYLIRKEFEFLVIIPKKTLLEINTQEIMIFGQEEKIFLQNVIFNIQKTTYNQNFILNPAKNVACVDFEKIRFPLTIRPIKHGDFFYPLNGKGKRKLKDFVSDLKLNILEKKALRLLCNTNGNIIWVINYRMDDRFKITDQTNEIIVFNTENH